MQPLDRKRTEFLLAVSALAVPATAAAEFFAFSLTRLRPLKYDEYIYRIDAIFGQPSFVLGRLVAHHRSLIILVSVTYGLLPIAIIGTFAVYLLLRPQSESLRVFCTFLLNLFVAVPIYLLFPVCGPRFSVSCSNPSRPSHDPDFRSAQWRAVRPYIKRAPCVVVFMALALGKTHRRSFLALTILATLGSGQHYLFDLLCAVPYTILIVWLGTICHGSRENSTEPQYTMQ